jgi:hypothetical protein
LVLVVSFHGAMLIPQVQDVFLRTLAPSIVQTETPLCLLVWPVPTVLPHEHIWASKHRAVASLGLPEGREGWALQAEKAGPCRGRPRWGLKKPACSPPPMKHSFQSGTTGWRAGVRSLRRAGSSWGPQ